MTNPQAPDNDMHDRMVGDPDVDPSRNPLRDRSRETDDGVDSSEQSGADDVAAFIADPAAPNRPPGNVCRSRWPSSGKPVTPFPPIRRRTCPDR